jgi:hypothetical protein
MEHVGDRFATEALLNAFQSIRIETMKIYYRQQKKLLRRKNDAQNSTPLNGATVVQSLVDEELDSVTGKAFVHKFDATIWEARTTRHLGWSPMGGPLFDIDTWIGRCKSDLPIMWSLTGIVLSKTMRDERNWADTARKIAKKDLERFLTILENLRARDNHALPNFASMYTSV